MIEWGVFGHGEATAGMYLAYHQSTLGYYLGNKISESYWPHNPLQNDPTSLELMIDHQFSKVTMAIWVVKFSREGGIQNWKDFCLKINTPKGNY